MSYSEKPTEESLTIENRRNIDPRIGYVVKQFGLTPRESQLVELFASGHGTTRLAEELHISAATVRTHLRNIFKALSISSRVELATLVLRQALREMDKALAAQHSQNHNDLSSPPTNHSDIPSALPSGGGPPVAA